MTIWDWMFVALAVGCVFWLIAAWRAPTCRCGDEDCGGDCK